MGTRFCFVSSDFCKVHKGCHLLPGGGGVGAAVVEAPGMGVAYGSGAGVGRPSGNGVGL